jgi:hypothetical protein
VKEAKEVLIKLLRAGTHDKHVAIVLPPHLKVIIEVLQTQYFYLFYNFLVERSNYQAVLRQLDNLNKLGSSIIFCAITVAGKLSASDVSSLIDRTHGGSLRILCLYYEQLLPTLQMTGKLSAVIMAGSKLKAKNTLPIHYYKDIPTLHAIYDHSNKYFAEHPEELLQAHAVEKIVRESTMHSWKDMERSWRNEENKLFTPNIIQDTFRLIITSEFNYVEKYYKSLNSPRVIIINCVEGNIERHVLNRIPNPKGRETKDHFSNDDRGRGI